MVLSVSLLMELREEVRKRLIVPSVRISSVEKFLQEKTPELELRDLRCIGVDVGSRDGVGVRERVDEPDEDVLAGEVLRKDLSHDLVSDFLVGSVVTGESDTDAWSSLEGAVVVDKGVVAPLVEDGEDDDVDETSPPKKVRFELWMLELSAVSAESCVSMGGAVSWSEKGGSPPSSVMRTERGSGRGAKRIRRGAEPRVGFVLVLMLMLVWDEEEEAELLEVDAEDCDEDIESGGVGRRMPVIGRD